jgi:hypothetical protein
MICPTCHGNGYVWGEVLPVLGRPSWLEQDRVVEQCTACSSSGEIGEREDDD